MNVTLAGVRATGCEIRVPNVGRWVADVDLDTADPIPGGKVTLKVGDVSFVGTVDLAFSGQFGGRRRLRLVAGANGWQLPLLARAWHNDAGVTDKVVLQATAAECGETLSFDTTPTRAGADYIRVQGRGAQVLMRIGGRWWVDYLGVTHVGIRTPPPLGKFDVLDFDARQNIATIATLDASSVQPGHVITDRLDRALTVRDLTITVGEDGARIKAWGTT